MAENEDLYKVFKDAFDEYYSPLCQYAHTIVEDLHAAEDIVQETFLKVWEKKTDLIGKKELKYYLFIAVRNNCFTWQKNKNKLTVASVDADTVLAYRVANPVEEPVKDTQAMINQGLDLLPPKCREVFVLSRISQFTYNEIATSLGISVKTVENQMGKAIKILRAFIKENKFGALVLLFILF